MNAASAAIAPSSPEWSCWGPIPATRSRACSDAVTTSADLSPATLNAFDAEVRLTPISRAASETSSQAVNVAPGSVSGAWISSASTQTPWSAQRSAIAASSPSVDT